MCDLLRDERGTMAEYWQSFDAVADELGEIDLPAPWRLFAAIPRGLSRCSRGRAFENVALPAGELAHCCSLFGAKRKAPPGKRAARGSGGRWGEVLAGRLKAREAVCRLMG